MADTKRFEKTSEFRSETRRHIERFLLESTPPSPGTDLCASLEHCNFFGTASILFIFDVLKRPGSLLFTFRTFCAITADGSRLWDSNRLIKIEKYKKYRKIEKYKVFDFSMFFDFSIFRVFTWSVVRSTLSFQLRVSR